MNSRKNNEKIINALQGLEPIHDETDEEREQRLKMEKESLENATSEPPLAFARKASGIFCIAVWVFSLISLVFGMSDIRIILPFILFAMAAVCGFNIPVFIKKGKILDIIISIIVTAACLFVGVGLLLF